MSWFPLTDRQLGLCALICSTYACAPESVQEGRDASSRAGWTPSTENVQAVTPPPSERPSPGPIQLEAVDVLPPAHPLTHVSEAALSELVRHRTAELGPASVGLPNRGRLFNAVQLLPDPSWHIEDPDHAWGTRETIESIQRAIRRVESDHPGSPPLHVGHISRERGGWLRPHRSHQSGRDVDLGYYYLEGPRWYAPATADNLDRARTWSLLMGLLTQGNVEYVFITRDVQALLLEYARSEGADEEWLGELFDAARPPRTPAPAPRKGSPAPRKGSPAARKAASSGRLPPPPPEPVVRHRWGHHTHLHVRFYSDAACETGRRASNLLRRHRKL